MNQPVDMRQFIPGGLTKFSPPTAHHRFQRDNSALRTVYNKIFKEKKKSITSGDNQWLDS